MKIIVLDGYARSCAFNVPPEGVTVTMANDLGIFTASDDWELTSRKLELELMDQGRQLEQRFRRPALDTPPETNRKARRREAAMRRRR